jgi:hypothetical protein
MKFAEPNQSAWISAGASDLTDLALEMERVERLWENDAHGAAWHFRFFYRTHWGRHLHNLRSYVHARQFGN